MKNRSSLKRSHKAKPAKIAVPRRLYIIGLSSFALALIAFAIGVAFHSLFVHYQRVVTHFAIWPMLGVIAFIFLNMILRKIHNTSLASRSAEDLRQRLLLKRETADKYVPVWKSQLHTIKVLTDIYAVLLGISGMVMSFATGAALEWDIFSLLYFVSVLAIYASLLRIRFTGDTRCDTPPSYYLPRANYPLLYALADRAATTLDCHGDIRILITTECRVSIASDDKAIILGIGNIFADLASEDELYNIFLHEFAHLKNKNELSRQDSMYHALVCSGGNHTSMFSPLAMLLYAFPDNVYRAKHSAYRYASSLVLESKADEAMRTYGNPAAAASALLKTAYYNLYDWETQFCDTPCFYESETPNTHIYRERSAAFKKALPKRMPAWRELVKNEILSRQASHPLTQTRLESLGVTDVTILSDQKSAELTTELDNAYVFTENLLAKQWHSRYDCDREMEYLEPMSIVESWKSENEPLDRYGDVVHALGQLGRFSQAEQLCDRVLAELPETKIAYAALIKGCFLLHRYDPYGIELIYKAIESSPRFFEEGIHIIGDFCCRTGNQEQLDLCRVRIKATENQ